MVPGVGWMTRRSIEESACIAAIRNLQPEGGGRLWDMWSLFLAYLNGKIHHIPIPNLKSRHCNEDWPSMVSVESCLLKCLHPSAHLNKLFLKSDVDC